MRLSLKILCHSTLRCKVLKKVLPLLALFALPPMFFALVLMLAMAAAAHEWSELARFARTAGLAFVAIVVAVCAVLLLWPGAGFARGWPAAVVTTASSAGATGGAVGSDDACSGARLPANCPTSAPPP